MELTISKSAKIKQETFIGVKVETEKKERSNHSGPDTARTKTREEEWNRWGESTDVSDTPVSSSTQGEVNPMGVQLQRRRTMENETADHVIFDCTVLAGKMLRFFGAQAPTELSQDELIHRGSNQLWEVAVPWVSIPQQLFLNLIFYYGVWTLLYKIWMGYLWNWGDFQRI